MPLFPYRGILPRLGERSWVAPGAFLTGDLQAGHDVSFFFGVVARGDVNTIRIGDRTNVQDAAILHVTHERFPLDIGSGVVIGHGAIVHGCRVEDGCLIGIGARVLDGAHLESGCQIGAGALVPPGMRVPAGHLVMGIPARVVRPLRPDEIANIGDIRDRYIAIKDEYRRELGSGFEEQYETPVLWQSE
jgi:carbonic anhydrase/acetyltransferase-like protein (isoleucine patch superfamily)